MTTDTDIRAALAAPFELSELKFFPAATMTRDSKKLGKVAPYADTRAYMDRFDAVLGPAGWSTSYRCIDPADKAIECTISVCYDGVWVAKADVGYPNEAKDADDPEKEPYKAAYSDAFKRAAVQHGVGRHLYAMQFERDWLELDQRNKFVDQPRIKGAQAAAAPAAARPPTQTLLEYTRQHGIPDATVIDLAQERYGKAPADLTRDEKRALIAALNEQKKGAAA